MHSDRPGVSESSSEFVEQLGPIGLPHDINVQSLFDPTGTGNCYPSSPLINPFLTPKFVRL